MSISDFHHAAREFASAGWPVFPCHPGTKKPAAEHGFHDATTSVEQIDKWWTENPQYNPACPIHQAGMSVVDPDGPAGVAAWEKLKEQHDVPDTYEVETPRGGRHVYFRGELPTSAWAPGRGRCLGEHIDTRGVGSYVLLPPSVITDYQGQDAIHNGKRYRVSRDDDLAPVPAWCASALAQHLAPARADVALARDAPGSIDRARDRLLALVARGDVAHSGQGGNNRTYAAATELSELGVSEAKAVELLQELYNPHCSPPWSDSELTEIVANAFRYAQNEPGAFAVAPAAEVFAQALDKLPAEIMKQQAPRSRFWAKDEAEQEEARDPEWLIPEIIPERATVLMFGASQAFKSFLVQHMLLAVAAKRKFGDIEPKRFGPTFYAAHEGGDEIGKPRRRAWRTVQQVEGPIPFYLQPAPMILSPEECEEFRENIRVRLRQSNVRIGAIVLDTVARCMTGLNENDARDINLFVKFCDDLRKEFDCAVIVLHHSGKDEHRGSRGSSALYAGFDSVLSSHRHEKTTLVELRILKHKDAEERSTPFTFEGKKVGSSLVFQAVTTAEYKAGAAADDPFTKQRVGKALQELGAASSEGAVSAAVLFDQLVPQTQEQTVEDRIRQTNTGAARLKALARGDLKAYCVRDGRELYWFLPG